MDIINVEVKRKKKPDFKKLSKLISSSVVVIMPQQDASVSVLPDEIFKNPFSEMF